jgi:hypothetical protein
MPKYKSDKEINKENLKRWQEESNYFSKLLPDLKSLKLKRIDITGDRNDSKHPDIDKMKWYLLCDNGCWWLTRPSEQWYGWVFPIGWSSIQLRHIDILFEIELPIIPKNPLGRVPYPEDEEE